MNEDVEKTDADHSIDLDSIIRTRNIVDARQEGNYLVLTTDTNITFRQRMPHDKILNKVNDKFILQDMTVL